MLTKFAADIKRASPSMRHWVMAPDIDINGTNARVTSLIGAFDSTPDLGVHVCMMGRFLDGFTECTDGRWRIGRREAQIIAQRSQ